MKSLKINDKEINLRKFLAFFLGPNLKLGKTEEPYSRHFFDTFEVPKENRLEVSFSSIEPINMVKKGETIQLDIKIGNTDHSGKYLVRRRSLKKQILYLKKV